MVLHVENLNKTYKNEHAELEEARFCVLALNAQSWYNVNAS